MEAVGLVLFWLIFFRRFFFVNPFCYATSEPMDTAFPSSRILGEWYRRGCQGEVDPYYYPYYTSIPFLHAYYPPHVIQGFLGSFLGLDKSFILYSFTMVAHFLFASVGAYLLFLPLGEVTAFFGSITLAYMGYNIKQNSCINYTVAWTPWLLLGVTTHNPWLTGVAIGMGTLAGYWPLWLYMVPFSCLLWTVL